MSVGGHWRGEFVTTRATTPWAASCAPAAPALGCKLTEYPVKLSRKPCWPRQQFCSRGSTPPRCSYCFRRRAGLPCLQDTALLLGLQGSLPGARRPTHHLPPLHCPRSPLLPLRGCSPPRQPPQCQPPPCWGPSDLPLSSRGRQWEHLLHLGAPRPHPWQHGPLPAGIWGLCMSQGATGQRLGVPSAGARMEK